MMRILQHLIGSGCAFLLCACGLEEDPVELSPGETDMSLELPNRSAPTTAAEFVDFVSGLSAFEIESAQLAKRMATNPAVIDYATILINDHVRITQELRKAAARADIPLVVSPDLSPAMQADLQALQNSGSNFGELYIQKQSAAHERMLHVLRAYGAAGDSAELRDFAAETAELAERHLAVARRIDF